MAGECGSHQTRKGRQADTYTIDRAIEKGYVSAGQYQDNADRGFRGVLNKIRLGSDNLTYLDTICEGTNVGSYSY